MINILIPIASKSTFFSEAEYPFPKPLIELKGMTMIERMIDNYKSIEEKLFIFIVSTDDCKKYHIDNIINILTNHNCIIIRLDNETRGAVCSAMMAIEFINNEIPLVIANMDQLFDENLNTIISSFKNSDAGVITFESVHPRWSYVKLDEESKVIESTEKKPISRKAIAGFYYFKYGKDFISSGSNVVKKDVCTNGHYYISSTLNEMILKNKQITNFHIEKSKYHTFFSPQKVKEYEMNCDTEKNTTEDSQ